ncbi:Rossmann-like and DUF2520 domain-containing protein [Roseateles oligotrophus]|uniref:DUF2520 domain-containing protein n=1 Tax=Roseateles oligotrophus TaxID=1769250 RepID=A0ABT2YEW4_9BURK|nr:DUF2520 domain-containing protein [Roseateles oligotrophus]MCV2368598.1 DUF2520 domain-containing protein [Roseateles oligotrophus]
MTRAIAARRLAFIGAGRLGQTLARACAARGLAVVAVASRSPVAAEQLAAQLPGCRALSAAEAAAAADLVFLSVPDDAIASLAASLPWSAGQALVHCSGATELTTLHTAAAVGAQVGGFHPLQIFSDPTRALALLAGSAVAIEVGAESEALSADLHDLARLLQMNPLQLQPGTRAAYHGAASFAASFLLSMLDEAAQVWSQIGLPPEAALQALLPLARGTLDAAAARGLAGALSGPISRGDRGVVAAHLQAFDGLGREHGDIYRELARRQLRLAQASGRLDEGALLALARLLNT